MASIDLLIRGAEALLPTGLTACDIAIADGRIAEIGPQLSGAARAEVRAGGRTMLPGLIDPHVHFNEPGRGDWEGFATGSAALAAGGGTCFFDMPLNSSPPLLDVAAFDAKLSAACAGSLTDFAFWGGLTPRNLDHMEALRDRGVVGFKAFMCDSGLDEFPFADRETLAKGMQIAARLGLPVAVHAEDQTLTSTLTRRAQADPHAGIEAFLASRPIAAELAAIRDAITLAGDARCDLHVVHVSCGQGVEIIAQARRAGARVTCETCPHYLYMCDADLQRLGTLAKCAPPLRCAAEQNALWRALLAGDIDFVASDHSPAPPAPKQADAFMSAWGGIAGVESTLPLLWTQGAAEHGLSAADIGRLTAGRAAERFGIAGKGQIAVGADADLVMLADTAAHELTTGELHSRHRLSPYLGREIGGVIAMVFARGRLIVRDNQVVGAGGGRLVTPSR